MINVTVDQFIADTFASAEAKNIILLTHPSKEHYFVLSVIDGYDKPMCHRVINAAQVVNLAYSLLTYVNMFSLEAWPDIIPLMGETKGGTT